MTQNITTDCQSATKLLNPKNPADWAHHPQNQLLSAIQRAQRKDIKWTPSHPERKNTDTASYTKEDYGIAMADGACEGDLRSPLQKTHIRDIVENLNIIHINTTTEEILANILETAPYAWTLNGIPLITSIQSLKELQREEEYRENRDTFAINECTRGRKHSTFWQETTLEHAAKIKQKAGLTKDQLLKVVAITYNWKSDGRNRAKVNTENEEKEQAEKCILCNETDSQYHALRECQQVELIQQRIITDEKIEAFIRKCEINDIEDNTPHIIRDNIKRNGSHRTLLGLWTTKEKTVLAQQLSVNNMPRWALYKAKKLLIRIGSIYMQGAYNIISLKHKIERTKEHGNINQNTHKKPTTQCSLTNNNVNQRLRRCTGNDVLQHEILQKRKQQMKAQLRKETKKAHNDHEKKD